MDIENDELAMLLKQMEEAEKEQPAIVCNTEDPDSCESCSG
jgi:hypothetical protein